MSKHEERQVQAVCDELTAQGIDQDTVSALRGSMLRGSGIGTWRGSAAPPPASATRGMQALNLNGFPHLARSPVIFKLKQATGAGLTNAWVLKPRIPTWVYGMVTLSPLAVAPLVTTSFKYAGDDAYPDAGEDQAGFVRLPDPDDFTIPLLDADASPWPIGMLTADWLSLRFGYTNTAATTTTWDGFVYGMTVDTQHPDYRAMVARCAPSNAVRPGA